MTDFYQITENFVIQTYSKDGVLASRGRHLLKTVERVRELDGGASEALLIAAVTHDVESAFYGTEPKTGFKDPVYLKLHQERSAKIVGDLLAQEGANNNLVSMVKNLIEHHELGGTKEQNLLNDADALAFFDTMLIDLDDFIARHTARGQSVKDIKDKIDWSLERIHSEKARILARPLHEKLLQVLNKG